VRLMIGTSRDEGSMSYADELQVTPMHTLGSVSEAIDWMARLQKSQNLPIDIASKTKQIEEHLIARYKGDLNMAAQRFFGTGMYTCPAENFLNKSVSNTPDLYGYKFERLFEETYEGVPPEIYGVYHTTASRHFRGLAFAVDTVNEQDRKYSRMAMKTFGDFIRGEKKLHFGDTPWQPFSEDGKVFLFREVATESGMVKSSDQELCATVWDEYTHGK